MCLFILYSSLLFTYKIIIFQYIIKISLEKTFYDLSKVSKDDIFIDFNV
jgi:hypothetical protein